MKNNIKNYGEKRNKMNNNSLLDFVNQVPEKKKEKLLDFVKNIPKKEKKIIPETKGTTPYEIIELMEQARPILQAFPGGPQALPLLTKLPAKEKVRIYQEAIFAGVSPGAWAAYTALQQGKNVAATQLKGEKYDPLARERLTQFIPEEIGQTPIDPIGLALPSMTGIAPKIPLKAGADIMETAMDYLIAQKGIRPAAKKIASFQPTKTILIEPKKIKDIFQTGKVISKEEMEFVKDLDLDAAGYKEAIKKGIKIKVPVSKMEFLKNKVYWGKIKGLFKGVKETIPTPAPTVTPTPVSPEKSLIRTEAEILKATHKSNDVVMKYVKDTVANGEALRKITEKVIAGTLPKTEAVKQVVKDIEKLEKPKVKVGVGKGKGKIDLPKAVDKSDYRSIIKAGGVKYPEVEMKNFSPEEKRKIQLLFSKGGQDIDSWQDEVQSMYPQLRIDNAYDLMRKAIDQTGKELKSSEELVATADDELNKYWEDRYESEEDFLREQGRTPKDVQKTISKEDIETEAVEIGAGGYPEIWDDESLIVKEQMDLFKVQPELPPTKISKGKKEIVTELEKRTAEVAAEKKQLVLPEKQKIEPKKYVEKYGKIAEQEARKTGLKYQLNKQDVEDLSQDLKVKLLEIDWDDYVKGEDIGGYIRTSLRRKTIDILRKKWGKEGKTVALEEFFPVAEEGKPGIKVSTERFPGVDERTGESIEQITRIITEPKVEDTALKELTNKQMVDILMRNPALTSKEQGYMRLVLKGNSQKEIAKQMNLSEGQMSKIATSAKDKAQDYQWWKLGRGKKLIREWQEQLKVKQTISTYGSVEKQNKAISDLTSKVGKTRIEGKVKTFSDIKNSLAKNGRVDYRGIKVRNAQHIAELFQVFRDQKAEHLHLIYLDKNNKILAHNTMSSGAVDYVVLSDKEHFFAIANRMKKLGATGLNLVHNHPSGNVKPSPEDVKFTEQISRKLRVAVESIVINHDKYSVIHRFDPVEENLPYTPKMPDWTIKDPAIDSPQKVIDWFRGMRISPDTVTVGYLDSNLGMIAYEPYNKEILNRGTLPETIRQKIKAYGARAYFVSGETINKEDFAYVTYPYGLQDVIIKTGEDSYVSLRGRRQLPFIEKAKIKTGRYLREEQLPFKSGEILKESNDLIFEKPFGKEESQVVLRRRIASKEQKIQKAAKDLEKIQNFFDKQPKEFNIDFMGKMEKGEINLLPKQLQEIAKALRSRLDIAYKRDKSIENKLDFIENYFPHIWKNVKNAERFIGNYVKKFVHTPSFSKRRYHEFISDGLNKGLELKTANPVELVLMREEASYHNEMTKNIMEDLKGLKLLKFNKGIRRPEFGWKGISGDRLKRYYPTDKGIVIAGEFVAPEPVANVLNKWLSPSLWYNQGVLGKGFRGIMKVKNIQVAMMLSLSGFHAIETGLSSIASNLSLAAFQMGRGSILKGMANIVKSPFSPFISVVKGWEGRNAWYKGPKTEYQKHALNLLIRAGARPSTDKVWRIGALKNFKRALLKGEYPGAITEFIPAICEVISGPIMNLWVPQLKTYAFLQRASDFVQSHSDMPQMEQDKKLTKIWDSIDNRFGQLVYDNLFWNRTIKDSLIASSLSLGWNLGNIREFGGGAYDMAKVFSAWGKGKQEEITDRAVYSLIYPLVVGIFGGLLTYGLTGKKPEKLLDYYAPKTGNKNTDGSDERLVLPAGTKEFFASRESIRKHGFISGPAVYLSHKAAPLISQTIDMLRNKNYYNVEIRNPNASAVKQAYQLFEFMATSQKPFSISGYLRQKEMGRPTILPFLGMNPAPGYITKTRIQKEIGDLYVARFGQAVKSKEMWEKSQFRKKLRERIQQGEKLSTAEARKLVKDGLISFAWIKKMRKLQMQGVLGRGDVVMFQRLNKEDQETLIKRMTKEEKSFYMKYAKKEIRLFEYRKKRGVNK